MRRTPGAQDRANAVHQSLHLRGKALCAIGMVVTEDPPVIMDALTPMLEPYSCTRCVITHGMVASTLVALAVSTAFTLQHRSPKHRRSTHVPLIQPPRPRGPPDPPPPPQPGDQFIRTRPPRSSRLVSSRQHDWRPEASTARICPKRRRLNRRPHQISSRNPRNHGDISGFISTAAPTPG